MEEAADKFLSFRPAVSAFTAGRFLLRKPQKKSEIYLLTLRQKRKELSKIHILYYF
jgi:hypothetical protein